MNRALQITAASTWSAPAQSLVGLMIWFVGISVVQPGWAPSLLLFGPLVLFPLLFDFDGDNSAAIRRWGLAAFLPVIASYAFEQDVFAAMLTLPWLVFTLALFGYRLRSDIKAVAYATILIHGYLIIGACWLVLARFGHRPLDFEHVIVHATAVHFHYAGFTLPILVLQLVRRSPGQRMVVMLCGLLLGVPLVATGITLSQFGTRWVECAAAWFFGAMCVWFAIEQLRLAHAVSPSYARFLLRVSSVSLMVAMTLALLYATGNYLQTPWLDIPLMIRTHAPIQVFGFALPGVVGWMASRAP